MILSYRHPPVQMSTSIARHVQDWYEAGSVMALSRHILQYHQSVLDGYWQRRLIELSEGGPALRDTLEHLHGMHIRAHDPIQNPRDIRGTI